MKTTFSGEKYYTLADVAAALGIPANSAWCRVHMSHTLPAPNHKLANGKRNYYTAAQYLEILYKERISR